MALDFPSTPTTGQTFQSGNQVWTYDGTVWKSSLASSGFIRQQFTATAGQTSFTVTNGYSPNLIDVYQNGVKLVAGTDVTITSGTAVVLAVGATAGDVIEVIGLASISSLDYLPLTGGTLTGDLTLAGNGRRIIGDFSNATVANRAMFQNSVTNSATQIAALPSGTATSSNFAAYNASDPTNASRARMQINASTMSLESDITGTGTYLPMVFYTNNSERLRIDTSGNVIIGANTTAPLNILTVATSGTAAIRIRNTANSNGSIIYDTTSTFDVWSVDARPLTLGTANTERMRIDSSGNVGIGTASPITTQGLALNLYNAANTGTIASNTTVILESVNRNANYQSRIPTTGTGNFGVYSSDGTTIYGVIAIPALSGSPSMLFYVNGSNERMRIDSSGNVGIGTIPTYTLDVSATQARARITSTTGTSNAYYTAVNTGGTAYIGLDNSAGSLLGSSGSAYSLNLVHSGAYPIIFGTSATERMRIGSDGTFYLEQGAQTSKAAAATLTAAELLNGILQYTGAAATITLPTGTTIETGGSFSVDMAYDWSVINTGSGTCTIGANGNTTVGALTVAAGSSGRFRIRKTAANTFTVYRIS